MGRRYSRSGSQVFLSTLQSMSIATIGIFKELGEFFMNVGSTGYRWIRSKVRRESMYTPLQTEEGGIGGVGGSGGSGGGSGLDRGNSAEFLDANLLDLDDY